MRNRFPFFLFGGSVIPTFPTYSGLVTRFNFANQSSVTTVSGKVSQIIDSVGGLVSSQATAGSRPDYHTSGGANNAAYASFGTPSTPSFLSGNLIPATSDFTAFVLNRLAATGLPSDIGFSFQNGSGNTGYGWCDWQQTQGKQSGGYLPGVTSHAGIEWYTSNNRWQLGVYSHTSNSNKLYNILGVQFPTINPTANLITPLASHRIGNNNGATGTFWLVGDLEEIIIYNRQLSDSEVSQMCAYLQYAYSLPLPSFSCYGGDSIFAGAGGTPAAPTDIAYDLLPSRYFYTNNTSVPGRHTQDIIDNLNTEVLSKYQSKVNDVYTLLIGHNDITGGSGLNPTTYAAALANIGGHVRSKGFKFVICTILYSTAFSNATCDSWNAVIRSGWTAWADALCDTNQLPQLLDPNNTTYYADGTHPTPAGSQVMATALEPIISGFL